MSLEKLTASFPWSRYSKKLIAKIENPRNAGILASREGSIDVKAEIINACCDKSHDETILLIKDRLPASSWSKQAEKSATDRLTKQALGALEEIRKRKEILSESNRIDFFRMHEILQYLLAQQDLK